MASSKSADRKKKKYYTVEEANKTLPLVRAIVNDIVREYEAVIELKERLSAVTSDRKRSSSDPYSEELAQSQTELDAKEQKLRAYIDELNALGVEYRGGPDGLCDFLSLMDGQEVYLCWRLGESEISHWHELNAGVAGRKPLAALAGPRSGAGPRIH
jgi:hypothetical protein